MLPRTKLSITTAIIHCSATPNGRYHDIIEIDQWHGPDRESQGKTPFRRRDKFIDNHQPHLRHIGYHYLIRTDGVVEFGRSILEQGAHARGFNKHSIGICLVGMDKFTPAQWTSLKTLIQTLNQTLPRMNKVIGHREVSQYKLCPCFDVKTWLNNNFTPSPQHIFLTKKQD